jgi:hypothetical protein
MTIPMWVVCLIPILTGCVCMWMSGRAERKGVYILSSDHSDVRCDDADRQFRRMGTLRVVAYIMALLFLWLT